MLLSVLIPVYNVEKYIRECIESVLSQSFTDYEVILINDGSTDSSGDVCNEYLNRYPDKVKVLHKKNGGLLMARRDAINIAKGDYLLFCDSDDFFSESAFAEMAVLIRQKQPDIIQYDLYLYDGSNVTNVNEGLEFVEPYKIYTDINILKECLLQRKYNVWSMCGKCVRRQCCETNIKYEDFKELKYGEDTLQSIDIYSHAKSFIYTPKHIYNYRMYSGMTAKLPYKYCEDNYVIASFLRKNLYNWDNEFYVEKVDFMILDSIYFLLLNISDIDYNYSAAKKLMKRVADSDDFRKAYNNLKNCQYYEVRAKRKMKILISLLYHKKICTLFFLCQIRRILKNR